MKLAYPMQDVIRNLQRFKLRSCLTIISIMIGAASIVALMSCSQMATHKVLSRFEKLGIHLLMMTWMPARTTSLPWQMDDIASLLKHKKYIRAWSGYSLINQPAHIYGRPIAYIAIASHPQLPHLLRTHASSGRLLSYLDHHQPYCLLGANVAHNLAQMGITTLIGQHIQVGQHYLRVLGVLKHRPKSLLLYDIDLNRTVIIPWSYAAQLGIVSGVQHIVLSLDANIPLKQIQQHLKRDLRSASHNGQWFMHSAEALITRIAKQRTDLFHLLLAIAVISLVVGGLGVMNIMLVAVTERRCEIGIRLVVGAQPSQIRHLFLLEAIVLSAVGSMLGLLCGIAVAFIIAWINVWTFFISIQALGIGLGMTLTVGLLAGYYPAYRASHVSPVKALYDS